MDQDATMSWEFVSQRSGDTPLDEIVTRIFAELRPTVYYYLLGRVGSTGEADELTQEAFLKLYRELRSGTDIRDVRLWLLRVAHNSAISRYRSQQRVTALDYPEWEELANTRPDPDPSPEQSLLEQERYNGVRRAMSRLNSQERQVLDLRLAGLGYRQIGEVLGIGTTTVSDSLSRAMNKVKAELDA